MKSLRLSIFVAVLAVAVGVGLDARASGGAVARDADGEADVVRTVVLLEQVAQGTRVTVRPEVRSSAGFAVVVPVAEDVEQGAAEGTDGGRLAVVDGLTAPRWVTYSSGCGSEPFGGAVPEDASESFAVEPSPPPFAGATATVVAGALSDVLAGLRGDGFAGLAPELDTADAGRWLVISGQDDLPADDPSARKGPAAPAFKYVAPGDPATVDLRLASLARSGRSDIIAITLADEPTALFGVPTAEMKTPSAAPKVGLDIREDYSIWVDRRVDFIGVGGAAAMLEFSGPITLDGEPRHASRWRISIPSGVPPPATVSFSPDPGRARHRVRAIVSASLAAPALLLLFLWAAYRARRRVFAGFPLATAVVVAIPLALSLGGCPSVGVLRGATVLERGVSEWSYALSPARDVRHDLNKEPPKTAQNRTPRTVQPEVSWRYGWRDETDVTLRMFAGGAKGEVRTLLLRQSDVGVNVSAGFGLSGFVHPNYGGVCAEGATDTGEDGCFSSLFGGGTVDVPVLVSRTVGHNEFYLGLRAGGLLMRGGTTYEDPTGDYGDVEVTKSVVTGMAGVIFGVSLGAGGYRLTPELQILSSRSAGGSVIWFPIVGVGFTPAGASRRVAAAR